MSVEESRGQVYDLLACCIPADLIMQVPTPPCPLPVLLLFWAGHVRAGGGHVGRWGVLSLG